MSSIPYSFDLFYQIHARYPHPSLFHLSNGAYYRAIRYHDDFSLAKVTYNNKLQIESLVGDVPINTVADILATDTNLPDFYAMARQNEALWAVVEPLYGLPLYRSQSLYEALIFVIIEQHISWKNAQKAQRVLVEWGNNFIEHDGVKHYVMPRPEQLASATIDELKPLKITFKRMELIISLARRFADDTDFLQDYESTDDLYQQLVAIKGIGHWTASVVVSRALSVYPFVPHNDVALQAAVARYFDVEKSAAATKAILSQYDDYAGLAAHFILMKWVLDQYPIVNG
ncbi:MAG: hypothetical protein AAF846_23965 [Chloroflexota bacterium]